MRSRRLQIANCKLQIAGGLVLFALAAILAAGCGSKNSQSKDAPPNQTGEPWIKADPNPVPVATGQGTTTVTWDSGDGAMAQVYLVNSKQEETLFSGGATGSQAAAWIAKGGKYEFRLYAGKEHKTILARVSVTSQ
jgi:small neutral amino acid transporter SnatA (MarC family)